jgi:type 1 glutamine amidotransferase
MGLQGTEGIVIDEWPQNEQILDDIATVVFIGDIFPPERLDAPAAVKASLGRLMARGAGIVCLHFATGLRAEHVAADGYHPLLDWLGGYYAHKCPHHSSVAKICTSTITPTKGSHPILRGWQEFTFDDEPYWNIYFGSEGPDDRVTPLASSMLPPEEPQKETVAWAVTRDDGGRGVGIVLPHYFRSWRIDDLRTLVLNAVGWTAKIDIPAEGIRSPAPDLAAFHPAAVDPDPPAR